MENNSSVDSQKNSNEIFGRSKIAKVKTIFMSDEYSGEKVNLMLKSGWKILDSYNVAYETLNLRGAGSSLYYVLGHEDSNAQIPLTKREINEQQTSKENFVNINDENFQKWLKQERMSDKNN